MVLVFLVALLFAVTEVGIAIATIAIALSTLIFTAITGSQRLTRSASSEWVRILEKRVEMCEEDRENLHGELEKVKEDFAKELAERDKTIEDLEKRELLLMRRLTKLEEA